MRRLPAICLLATGPFLFPPSSGLMGSPGAAATPLGAGQSLPAPAERTTSSLETLDAYLAALQRSPDSLAIRAKITDAVYRIVDQARRRNLGEEERREAVEAAIASLKGSQARSNELKDNLELVRRELGAPGGSQEGLLKASAALSKLGRGRIEDQILRDQMGVYIRRLQERLRKAVAAGSFTGPKDQLAARGFIWYYQKDYERALRYWRQALALDPSDDALREQTLWVERRLRERQRREAIERLLTSAQELGARGRYEETMSQLQMISLLEPTEEDLKRLKELEERARKRAAAARAAAARRLSGGAGPLEQAQAWLGVLDLEPAHAEARAALQAVQKTLVQGPPSGAERVAARPARPSQPATGPSAEARARAERDYALGLIYYAQNDLVRARQAMETALRAYPGLKSAQVSLERIRMELGGQ